MRDATGPTWPPEQVSRRRAFKRLAVDVTAAFIDHEGARLAAALSFYAILALPAMMILIFAVGGLVVNPDALQRVLVDGVRRTTGQRGVELLQPLFTFAGERARAGVVTSVVGFAALLFSSTGLFTELQFALNQAWQLKVDARGMQVRVFVARRVVSFAMLGAAALLLLLLLAAGAVISLFGRLVPPHLGAAETWTTILPVAHALVSLAGIGVLLFLIYRWLPDGVVPTRDAALGAGGAAVLFVLGNTVVMRFLAGARVVDAYGAAGSLAALLLWIYYSSIVVLVGAEFIQVWAARSGRDIVPERGAELLPSRLRRLSVPLLRPGHKAAGPARGAGPPAQLELPAVAEWDRSRR